MNLRPCSREAELSAVLRAGQWPDACDPALRNHVEGCDACSEYLVVKTAFMESRAAAIQRPRLQSTGILWWRAQLRRRDEALKQLNQPVSIAGTVALLSTLAVAIGFAVMQWRLCWDWLRWLAGASHSESMQLTSLWTSTSGWGLMLLIPCVASVALLGCYVVYLATEKQ
jgi:hypothetical protein